MLEGFGDEDSARIAAIRMIEADFVDYFSPVLENDSHFTRLRALALASAMLIGMGFGSSAVICCEQLFAKMIEFRHLRDLKSIVKTLYANDSQDEYIVALIMACSDKQTDFKRKELYKELFSDATPQVVDRFNKVYKRWSKVMLGGPEKGDVLEGLHGISTT